MKATWAYRRAWATGAAMALLIGRAAPAASILAPARNADSGAYLGARITTVAAAAAEEPALQVAYIDPTGPAAQILRPGDMLTAIDDQPLISEKQLRAWLATASPGDAMALTWRRNDTPGKGVVTLGTAFPTADALWSADDAEPVTHDPGGAVDLSADGSQALRDARIDALVDSARESDEQARLGNGLGDAGETRFPDDMRKHIAAADLPLPSTDPDDYRRRKIPVVTLTGERNTTVMSRDDGNLSLAEQDGQTIYTFRDPNGIVLYEGPVNSREDRERIPFDVWKRYYEMEREQMKERRRKEIDE